MFYDARRLVDPHLAVVKRRSYRPNFVSQISSAASIYNVRLSWLSNNYIAVLESGYGTKFIVGYYFPLNSAAASMAADDKVATAEILTYSGVPNVGQSLIRFKSTKGLTRQMRRVVDLFPFPMVVKPYRGTGGRDVTRIDSEEGLVATFIDLRKRHQALAVSSWLDIKNEYRVIVLHDRVQLMFEKVRTIPQGRIIGITRSRPEWRHNLRFGSVPVVKTAHDICTPLSMIALRAMRALGLNFASVDIVATSGGLAVLEINSGVCLEKFSTFSPEHFYCAGQVYSHALGACITTDRE